MAKKILNNVETFVSEQQLGFMPGRLMDNLVRSAQDILKFANQEKINAAIISIDLQKAFDSVEHDYILRTLLNKGMDPSLVRTIEIVLKSGWSTVLINGTPSEPFRIDRGVRQGCPLSVLLFIIAFEPFMEAIENNENIRGFEAGDIRRKAGAYADDCSLFISGSEDELFKSIEEILLELGNFEQTFGSESQPRKMCNR